jgi:hypothetical protein
MILPEIAARQLVGPRSSRATRNGSASCAGHLCADRGGGAGHHGANVDAMKGSDERGGAPFLGVERISAGGSASAPTGRSA